MGYVYLFYDDYIDVRHVSYLELCLPLNNARAYYIDGSCVYRLYDATVDYFDVSYVELSLPALQCQGRLHRRELHIVMFTYSTTLM